MGFKKYLSLLPKFWKLLLGLLKDSRVSAQDKAILVATIAYLLNPSDFVPDAIPFFGMVDDLYLIALALIRLLNRVDEDILREHWSGEEDIVPLIKQMAEIGARLLPARIREAVIGNIYSSEGKGARS